MTIESSSQRFLFLSQRYGEEYVKHAEADALGLLGSKEIKSTQEFYSAFGRKHRMGQRACKVLLKILALKKLILIDHHGTIHLPVTRYLPYHPDRAAQVALEPQPEALT